MYEEHDYRNNVLNGLITSPEERNYSDDEQYFQAILPFFIYCDQVWGENLDVIDTFKTGIEQVWKYAKKDGSSAWGSVVKWALLEKFEDDAIIVKNLQELPLEQVDWKVDNNKRQDVHVSEEPNRSHEYGKCSIEPLHAEEQCYMKWNFDPYELQNGSGGTEYPGGVFLMPYWLDRFYSENIGT